MSAAVEPFLSAGRMTEAQYDAERHRLRATYGDTSADRTGAFDQALARLFHRSNWTQEQVAQKEGKTQQWVAYRLRFGRFLTFTTTVVIPKNLTERRFREYWERADPDEKNERMRFQAVQRLMEQELLLSKSHSPIAKRPVAQAILDRFADGGWHRLTTIVAHVGAPEADVLAVLSGMEKRGTHHTFCERRKGGRIPEYRLIRGHGRTVDVDVLLQQVSPIVQALESEGRKHVAQFSPRTIAKLAHDLRVLLEQLTKEAVPPPRRRAATQGANHVSTRQGGNVSDDAGHRVDVSRSDPVTD